MRFIIGGAFQGKLEYAESLNILNIDEFKDGSIIKENIKTQEELKISRGIYNLHLLIKELFKIYNDEEKTKEKVFEIIKNKEIIITDETGYGIVPMDKFERDCRELTGRICCSIAQKAESVERIVCGIPVKIK